jgi:integrase/recombinase XerC
MHSSGRSGRGIALILSGWRGFYTWLGREGVVQSNPVQDVRAPKAPKPLPKALSVDDAMQLAEFSATPDITDPWLECRDAAMVELLYGCGLRVGELVGLDVQASNTAKGWLDLEGAEAHVLGKGSKRRSVPIGKKALDAAHAWLVVRDQGFLSEVQNALFIGQHGTLNCPRHLATPQATQFEGGPLHPCASPYAAPFIRKPSAAVEQRFTRSARVAWARQYQHYAGLHAFGFSTFGQGL